MNIKCIGGFQVYKNLKTFATKAKTERGLAVMGSWHTK